MTNSERSAEIVRLFNAADHAGIMARLAPAFVWHDAAFGAVARAGFAAYLDAWRAAMPDASIADPEYHGCGDTVFVLFSGRGTLRGTFRGAPAAHGPVAFDASADHTWGADGLLESGRVYFDTGALR